MKRWLCILLLMVIAPLCYAGTIEENWSYDYSQATSGACGGGVSVNCVTGFRGYYVSPKTGQQVTFFTISNPTGHSGLVTGITGSGYVGIVGSNIVFGVVATALNGSGSYTESAPVTTTVTLTKVRHQVIVIK